MSPEILINTLPNGTIIHSPGRRLKSVSIVVVNEKEFVFPIAAVFNYSKEIAEVGRREEKEIFFSVNSKRERKREGGRGAIRFQRKFARLREDKHEDRRKLKNTARSPRYTVHYLENGIVNSTKKEAS